MDFNKPPSLWALVIAEGTDSRREGAIEARGVSLLRRWPGKDSELLRREGTASVETGRHLGPSVGWFLFSL